MALRYELDILLHLRESPLCVKPKDLPPREDWMGYVRVAYHCSNYVLHANRTKAPHPKQHAPRPRPPPIDSRQKGRCSSKAVDGPVLSVMGLEMEAVCVTLP